MDFEPTSVGSSSKVLPELAAFPVRGDQMAAASLTRVPRRSAANAYKL
jgi:hypothetical protein